MSSTSKQLTVDQGQTLVQLARQTLMEHFGRKFDPDLAAKLERQLNDPALQVKCGTFVTLKINGSLRGCIGSLEGHEPLAASVRSNAINAAFHDPRFSPLSNRESDRVTIEVSVLTTPKLLVYKDVEDLLAKLRPHIDGVILRKGLASATFLPQVWDQLPRVEDFLNHLCMKAGLSAKAWRQGQMEISIYQVQRFEEDY